jgi:transglutaminase-like putative cysteine protease
LELDLRLEEKNAFHFLLASHASDMPFRYEPHEQRILTPFLQPTEPRAELPFWELKAQPTVSALVGLNNAIYENLKYEVREEGAARTPAETLAAGVGACRDYAVLLAETLRGIGIAARLASGYVCESDEAERRSEGAFHAWTEAYLPGAGWVGMDPTNGTFCNHNHITAAVGLLPGDVAPIIGNYFASHPVPARMDAALTVQQCDE